MIVLGAMRSVPGSCLLFVAMSSAKYCRYLVGRLCVGMDDVELP